MDRFRREVNRSGWLMRPHVSLGRPLRLTVADALPPVREYGSIGTGDLSAMATTALALIGELEPVPPKVVRFDEHDALAFLSSNAATIGDAALAVAELAMLARAALVVASLT